MMKWFISFLLITCWIEDVEVFAKVFVINTENVLNETCTDQCTELYSLCVNGACYCIDNFVVKDNKCVKEKVKTSNECSSQTDCTGDFSYCKEDARGRSCQCMRGYRPGVGKDCVLEESLHFKRQTISPRVGTPCHSDAHCHPDMECDVYSLVCRCRFGYVLINGQCQQPFQPSPHQPYTQFKPANIPLPPPQTFDGKPNVKLPSSDQLHYHRGNSDYHLSWSDRKPANPSYMYYGAYGHKCSSSKDCLLDYLYCDPYTKKCDCKLQYHLEGGDCVRQYHIEMSPEKDTVKHYFNTELRVSHGHSCKINADCMSAALVCHLQYYICICAQDYHVDGQYCVRYEGGEHPTMYIPKQPPVIDEHPYYSPNPYPSDKSYPTTYVANPYYPKNPVIYNSPNYKRHVLTHTPENGIAGEFCSHDGDCVIQHTHCYQQKCQCAIGYTLTDGVCTAEPNYHSGYCNEDLIKCDIQNSECDNTVNKCKCVEGYTRYKHSCIPDGELHGRCLRHHSCNKKELTCLRPYSTCRCGIGYREYSLSCYPESYF